MVYQVMSRAARMPASKLSAERFSGFCRGYFGADFAEGTVNKRLPQVFKSLLIAVPDLKKFLHSVVAIGKGRATIEGEHNDHELCNTISVPMENGTICVGLKRLKTFGDKGVIRILNSDDGQFPHFDLYISVDDFEALNKSIAARKRSGASPLWYEYPVSCVLELMHKYPKLKAELGKSETVLFFDGMEPFGVPVASGLSSSAAIENAALVAMVNLYRECFPGGIERSEIAEIAVAAENSIANCGRLDQHTSIAPAGRQGVVLDYYKMVRDQWEGAYEFFDIPEQLLLGVVDSGQKASTAQAGYRIRRLSGWVFAACFFHHLYADYEQHDAKKAEALINFLTADHLRSQKPSLRDIYMYGQETGRDPQAMWNDVVMKMFTKNAYTGPEILGITADCTLFKGPGSRLIDMLAADCGLEMGRIQSMLTPVFKPQYGLYVLGEQGRVMRLYADLMQGNLGSIAGLMRETHYGMTDVYEAGTKKNTEIVKILEGLGIASRIVGAGFGGWNVFAIIGADQEERVGNFKRAKKALLDSGFANCFMVTPGCGSAVFEPEAV